MLPGWSTTGLVLNPNCRGRPKKGLPYLGDLPRVNVLSETTIGAVRTAQELTGLVNKCAYSVGALLESLRLPETYE